ncbi:MAG: hypothetical protein ACLQDM_14245 [Bradyrhizobium sp.]
MLLFALTDYNEAVYLSNLDRWKKPGVGLCNKCSEVANVRPVGARCSDAPKAAVLPLSVFGALFVGAARIIPGHPGFAAFRKSAKKDAF